MTMYRMGFWRTFKMGFGNPQEDIGLLDGTSGIGLVLLAAVSAIEPTWDECFLLS